MERVYEVKVRVVVDDPHSDDPEREPDNVQRALDMAMLTLESRWLAVLTGKASENIEVTEVLDER